MSKVKKKRRHYCAEYTKFGFIENPTNPSSPLCLLCLKTFSNEAMKPSRLQDHLNKMHPDKKDNNVAYFQDLEKKHNTQPSVAKLFSVASKQDDDGFRASYNISLLIAQKGKPHNIREELILPAIMEVKMLGGLCQSLLVKYGMSEASSMGSAFHGFLTTASACLLTTALLIACYVLSSNTQQLIRQSIFECMFNAVACFLYLSASSYMGFAVNIYLYPRYALVNMYAAYPAMTAVYYIGVVVGILHGVDAYLSYKYHKGYR